MTRQGFAGAQGGLARAWLGSLALVLAAMAQPPAAGAVIQNVEGRRVRSLDGRWHAIVDPYDVGYYDYRLRPRKDGYFKNKKPKSESDRVEYNFDTAGTLRVPGDWNTQRKELLYYEGAVWYQRSFRMKRDAQRRMFVRFGAVNYDAIVWLNGKKLGQHVGGFTPFEFEITDQAVDGQNVLVVRVDNRRIASGVPTINTDWWNYGGITRSVKLVRVPKTFVRDYEFSLQRGSETKARKVVKGWVQLDGPEQTQQVTVEIPASGAKALVTPNASGRALFSLAADVKLWSPRKPHLTKVIVSAGNSRVVDRIGFRTVKVEGREILINGKPVFLRGISIHEEAPKGGRAHTLQHARTLLSWARQLGCNFVRLAHYPHNEHMVKTAERMGLMVWSEIPVYWTVHFDNADTYANAERQLREMIGRDRNRGAVILWSIGNETPVHKERTKFMQRLAAKAREFDGTRLVTAALEQEKEGDTSWAVVDPLGSALDVLGLNEYLGWYRGLPEVCKTASWKSPYDKPFVISEFGAGAKAGYRGGRLKRWTEDYQDHVYENQIRMLRGLKFVRGMTPWILKDFRSPRRPLAKIQDGWNRKGLVSETGRKKRAFFRLRRYYRELQRSHPDP